MPQLSVTTARRKKISLVVADAEFRDPAAGRAECSIAPASSSVCVELMYEAPWDFRTRQLFAVLTDHNRLLTNRDVQRGWAILPFQLYRHAARYSHSNDSTVFSLLFRGEERIASFQWYRSLCGC